MQNHGIELLLERDDIIRYVMAGIRRWFSHLRSRTVDTMLRTIMDQEQRDLEEYTKDGYVIDYIF